VRFLRSALTVFDHEAKLHAIGRCSAGSAEPFLPIPAEPPAYENDWS
jgi:hypothetical protein